MKVSDKMKICRCARTFYMKFADNVTQMCSFSSPEPRVDPRLWETLRRENMRRRVLVAKNWLFEPYGACSLLVLT